LCFIGALAVGFAAGNTPSTIVLRAVIVMVVSWVVGQALGLIAQRTIERQVKEYKNIHPFPPLSKFDVVEGSDKNENTQVVEAEQDEEVIEVG